MLTTEHLARALIADRERELRERHRAVVRMASGPRHPARAEVGIEQASAVVRRGARRPAPAPGA